jgi:hypothetical protein
VPIHYPESTLSVRVMEWRGGHLHHWPGDRITNRQLHQPLHGLLGQPANELVEPVLIDLPHSIQPLWRNTEGE